MTLHDDTQLRADLLTMKHFFEHQFGCVVGCGCWGADWDDEARVRAFARDGFLGWPSGPTVADVIGAFDRAAGAVGVAALPIVQEVMELRFDAPADFHRFFGKAHRTLADEHRGQRG